jgi:hypothetical protein
VTGSAAVDQTGAGESQAERLDRARSLLAQAATVGKLHRPPREQAQLVAGAGVVALDPVLAGLFPGGGLPWGATVSLAGSNALLLSVLAHPSSTGVWSAVVGMPDVGLVAAEEAGLDLAKTALVPNSGDQLLAVLATLLDGIDLVAVAGTEQLRAADRQRLAARARQRGAVLLPVGSWPGADLHVATRQTLGGWRGLGGVGQGHGRLRERHVTVVVTGRGAARAPRTAPVLLPGPTGAITRQPSGHARFGAIPAGESGRRAS